MKPIKKFFQQNEDGVTTEENLQNLDRFLENGIVYSDDQIFMMGRVNGEILEVEYVCGKLVNGLFHKFLDSYPNVKYFSGRKFGTNHQRLIPIAALQKFLPCQQCQTNR